eukprot:scaffold1313_cov406-Prasinococcus_capsulatus_cf.AAC.1
MKLVLLMMLLMPFVMGATLACRRGGLARARTRRGGLVHAGSACASLPPGLEESPRRRPLTRRLGEAPRVPRP